MDRQNERDGVYDDDVISGKIEHEFPVEEAFDPCPYAEYGSAETCGATDRYIRLVSGNFGKALYCGNGHRHDFEGKTFIPAEEFGPFGRFKNVLPEELRPDDEELRGKRWKIGKRVRKLLDQRNFCAACGSPPLDTFHSPDTSGIWDWLNQHDGKLFAEVRRALAQLPGFEFKNWYGLLPSDLKEAVRTRMNNSLLQYDHGIPRAVANELWWRFSPEGRAFLQSALIFRLCRRCNAAKGKRLLDRDELIRRYVAFYFDGSEPAAMHDVRWNVFMDVLDIVYAAKELAG